MNQNAAVGAESPQMRKAGEYRSLRRGPHGMEPNFVLPASEG
jgi:hypothetical protein